MQLLQVWASTPDRLEMRCESCGFGLCVVDGGECRGQLLRGCGVESGMFQAASIGEELIQDFRPLVVFVLAREKFLSSVGVSRFMRAPSARCGLKTAAMPLKPPL